MTNPLLKAAGITPGDIDFAAERARADANYEAVISCTAEIDRRRKEKELLLSVLKDWLEFSRDSFVTANEREFDRLRALEKRTARIVDPCS